MKKIIAIAVSLLAVAFVANAQSRSLGVRLGYGGEVSYQHTLSADNFLEVDAGWGYKSVSIGAAYDFQIAPVGPFGFYAGPSAQIWAGGDDDFVLGVGGQLGLEYLFDEIPLQISLDRRPVFTLVPGTGFGWQSVGLGVRYLF